ncbi:hypothetical protein BP6252_08082 [Coleophoma cylindrospora]|uniref:Mid2 domain-containing protein n=1 Tax=Coleophoma cylindrospora TaxID=1849047 RepID=A0A3D8RBT3_9HELO|nr:hypothetical protein BP6252_08082 [Coleophoma cylindrospora]
MHLPILAARKHLFLATIIHGLTNALLFEPTRTQSGLLASCTAIGSEPTNPTKTFRHELKPRQAGSENAICGWIDGNSGSAVSCGSSHYCATEQSFVGCCQTSSCIGIVTACYDILGAICDAACQQEIGNLVCRSSLPYCATYSYPGGSVGYGCNVATGYTKSVLLTYTTGPGSFSPSSISSSSSSSVLNPSSTASPTASPTPKKGITGGAIAGIIIGSVATIALVGTLVWWLMRSRKGKTGDHSPQPLQNMQQSQHQVQRQLAHTSNLSGSTEGNSPVYKYSGLAHVSPPPDSTNFAGSDQASLPARTSPYGSDFSGAGSRNSQHFDYRGPLMPEMSGGNTNPERIRPRSNEY